MNELKARVIDSWVTSLFGFGLLGFAFGFVMSGHEAWAGVCFTVGIGLIAKKETKA